jgi:hypothetical protein
MAHTVPQPGSRRPPRWHVALGAALVVAGLVFGIVAVVALSKPHGRRDVGQTVALTGTGVPAPPVTDDPTTSGATSASSTKSPSGSKSSGSKSSGSPASPGASGSPGASSSPGATYTNAAAAGMSVVILNDTDVSGLAARAQGDLQAQGWTVSSATDYSNDIVSTAAYYDPDVDGSEAAAEALQAQFSWIKRVVPRFPQLPDSPIVLILTASY